MDDGFTPGRASEWIAALTMAPDDAALRKRFEAWLASDPAHQTDWAEMVRTYEVMGMTLPAHREHWDSFAARRQPIALPKWKRPMPGGGGVRRPGTRQSRRMACGLAGLAAAACLSFVFLPSVLIRLRADYATATAQLRTMTLADGTHVHLGPQSAIAVVFSSQARHVRLLKGEAFFEVMHDTGRPFSVEAGGVKTTDVGTAFEVRLAGGETEVGVREGLVRIEDPMALPPLSQQLGAGQWVRVAADRRVARGSGSPQDIAPWLQGQIVARNQPTGEVVDELRRYYNGIVILRSRTLAAQPITGVFNIADPVEALRAVARSQGASLSHPLPWVVVLSARE